MTPLLALLASLPAARRRAWALAAALHAAEALPTGRVPTFLLTQLGATTGVTATRRAAYRAVQRLADTLPEGGAAYHAALACEWALHPLEPMSDELLGHVAHHSLYSCLYAAGVDPLTCAPTHPRRVAALAALMAQARREALCAVGEGMR